MAPSNLLDFISESQHIINAHRRHFYTLSLIFLIPFSFIFLLSPTRSHLFNHFLTDISHHQPHSLVFPLLYSLFTLLFSICGVISTIHSFYHFFYAQPVTLLTAIKSISASFLPLLATTIVSQVIIFFVSLFYGLLLLLVFCGVLLFDVTIPYSYPYIIGIFVALPLLLVLIYLQLNWTLVPVIVVVESCWGLEPLRKSTRLIRGMKGVALSSFFFYGFFAGIVELNCMFVMAGSNGYRITGNWVSVVRSWVIIVGFSCFLATVMLSNLAVNTVLYTYCKANHGETAEEFGKDYVSLPSRDGNVSDHAV